MPVCCQCGTRLRQGWSDPADPVLPLRCAACGTGQHRADLRWPFLVGAPILTVLAAVAAFAPWRAWGMLAAMALVVLVVAAAFAREAHASRRVPRLATRPGGKRTYRLALAAVLPTAGAWTGTQAQAEFQAQPATTAGEPR